MKRAFLCDTTLRDGEQAPGVAFSANAKVRLAKLLDEVGVAEIEAGTPVSGGEEAEAVRRVAALGLNARVSGWCRALPEDVDAAIGCGLGAVAVAVPVSGEQLRGKLKRDAEWAVNALGRAVAHASSKGLFVVAALEDAGRAEYGEIERFAKAASDAGASRLRLSDTVGILDPFATHALVEAVGTFCGLPLEFHAHDDFGLAGANTLAAWRAGATHLSVTALGLGERAGNAALEEVSLALERLYGVRTAVDLRLLGKLAELVALESGRPVAPAKAVVGEMVFTHESGIHVDGLLKDSRTYEAFPPSLVGRSRKFALGKHSGKGSLKYHLEKLGLDPGGAELNELLSSVRRRALETGRGVDDSALRELYAQIARRDWNAFDCGYHQT